APLPSAMQKNVKAVRFMICLLRVCSGFPPIQARSLGFFYTACGHRFRARYTQGRPFRAVWPTPAIIDRWVGDVTQLLAQWAQGDRGALDSLTSAVYSELRKIADAYLRREHTGHTLQPTALVHEAWMRLVRQDHASFENRKQFFALAAQIMRQIL